MPVTPVGGLQAEIDALLERFRVGAALNTPDRNTFFAPPTAQGYIDYPTLATA